MKFRRLVTIVLAALFTLAPSIAFASITANPTLVGRLEDQTQFDIAYQVVVDGNYAYVINDGGDTSKPSLVDINIQNPTQPTIVGVMSSISFTAALPQSIAKAGNYLYVGTNGGQFGVVDVANPASPTLVAVIPATGTLSSANIVAVSGNYAYVGTCNGANTAAFIVIDISNPLSPNIVASLSDATRLNCDYDMQIVGTHAYITNDQGDTGQADFTIIDVSDPIHPSIIGSLEDQTHLGFSSGIAIVGNVAFTSPATDASRIAAIDITDPTNPELISTTSALPDGSVPASISLVDVVDGYAFYSANSTLGVVDVSNPQSMLFVGSATSADIGGSYGLAVQGDYAYILNSTNTSGAANFNVADISNILNPPLAPTPPTLTGGGGGGQIVGSGPTAPSAEGLPGYVKPRPQIDYPNGSVVYLDATSSASTTPPVSATTSSVSSATPSRSSSAVPSTVSLMQNRQLWDQGEDIRALQKFFNTHGFFVAQSGPGSPGNETSFFGTNTYRVLIKFQRANKLPTTGYLGPLTRALINSQAH